MAREVVRFVQDSRKKADLQPEDRIAVSLQTDAADLRQAIDEHRKYIDDETLTVEWATQSFGDGAFKADGKVDGKTHRVA